MCVLDTSPLLAIGFAAVSSRSAACLFIFITVF